MAFNSIPADRIVSIIPGTVGTGGTPLSASTLLILPQTSLRVVGVREFGSAAEVGQYFGLGSDEFGFAERYFLGFEGATKNPDLIWMATDRSAALPAILQSASMTGVTVDDIKQTGDLILTVGGTAYTLSLNLSTITSFSEAATAITAALTTATAPASCAYVAESKRFEITTTATGDAATISFASDAMAATLRLREQDGALAENGTDAMTPAELMTYVKDRVQNFMVITHLEELLLDDKKAFAAWNTTQNSRFMFVAQDTAGAALTPNNAASFGAWLQETDQDGTVAYFGGIDKIAALCGGIAAIDFKRTNGRRNIMFMRQAGLAADVTSEVDYTALVSNNYTFYAAFATANDRFQFQTNGEVSGAFKWADNYINQIYLNSQLQLALITMLVSYGSIPYNETGKAYHRAAVLDPINEMLNFGGIAPLVDPDALSQQQKSIINSQAGRDVIPELLAKGWVIDIKTADAQTRGNRGSMPFTLWYTDGGSVQSVNLASVNVQ